MTGFLIFRLVGFLSIRGDVPTEYSTKSKLFKTMFAPMNQRKNVDPSLTERAVEIPKLERSNLEQDQRISDLF